MSGLAVPDFGRCYRRGLRCGRDGEGETEGWERMVEEDGIGDMPDEAAGEHRVGKWRSELRATSYCYTSRWGASYIARQNLLLLVHVPQIL